MKSPSTFRLPAFGLLLGSLVVLLAACDWGAKPPPVVPAVKFDAGPELSLVMDETAVQITGEDGAIAEPLTLPHDVMLFADAHVALAVQSPQGEFVTYSVAPPGFEVRKFYVDALATAGWQLTSEKNSDVTHELAARKSDRQLFILIDASDNGTQVTLSHERG